MPQAHRLSPTTRLTDDRLDAAHRSVLQPVLGDNSRTVADVLADVPDAVYRLERGMTLAESAATVTTGSVDGAALARRAVPLARALVHVERQFSNTLWRSFDDRTKYEVSPAEELPFFKAAWILGDVSVRNHQQAHLTPLLVEEDTGQTLLPDYGGTDVANFARSRGLSRLATMVRFPDLNGAGSSNAFASVIFSLHRPDGPENEHDRASTREAAVRALADMLVRQSTGQRPPPRLINGPRQAEEYAGELMEAFGFTGVQVTPPGSDRGIDVLCDQAVAQVKMEAVPTARPVLQGIYGNAAHSGKQALVFSLAGFTAQSVQWADEAGIALFQFSHDGTIAARSAAAEDLEQTLGPKPEASAFGPARSGGDLVAQLSELARLKESGALTAEEFSAAKARLLS